MALMFYTVLFLCFCLFTLRFSFSKKVLFIGPYTRECSKKWLVSFHNRKKMLLTDYDLLDVRNGIFGSVPLYK